MCRTFKKILSLVVSMRSGCIRIAGRSFRISVCIVCLPLSTSGKLIQAWGGFVPSFSFFSGIFPLFLKFTCPNKAYTTNFSVKFTFAWYSHLQMTPNPFHCWNSELRFPYLCLCSPVLIPLIPLPNLVSLSWIYSLSPQIQSVLLNSPHCSHAFPDHWDILISLWY